MRQHQPGFLDKRTFKRTSSRRMRRDDTTTIEGLMEVVQDRIEMLERRLLVCQQGGS
jgi:hypothetical protein